MNSASDNDFNYLENLDLNEICRVCLSHDINMDYLFNYNNEKVIDRIEFCSGVQVCIRKLFKSFYFLLFNVRLVNFIIYYVVLSCFYLLQAVHAISFAINGANFTEIWEERLYSPTCPPP